MSETPITIEEYSEQDDICECYHTGYDTANVHIINTPAYKDAAFTDANRVELPSEIADFDDVSELISATPTNFIKAADGDARLLEAAFSLVSQAWTYICGCG
jgi:hypothetical protein